MGAETNDIDFGLSIALDDTTIETGMLGAPALSGELDRPKAWNSLRNILGIILGPQA